jgi:hypothetical protein
MRKGGGRKPGTPSHFMEAAHPAKHEFNKKQNTRDMRIQPTSGALKVKSKTFFALASSLSKRSHRYSTVGLSFN